MTCDPWRCAGVIDGAAAEHMLIDLTRFSTVQSSNGVLSQIGKLSVVSSVDQRENPFSSDRGGGPEGLMLLRNSPH